METPSPRSDVPSHAPLGPQSAAGSVPTDDLEGVSLRPRTLDDMIEGYGRDLKDKSAVSPDDAEELAEIERSNLALQNVLSATARADALVRPSRPGNSESAITTPHQKESAEIQRAVDTLCAIVDLAGAVNQIGDPKNLRAPEAADQLLYAAAQAVKTRIKSEVIPGPQPHEKRLLNTIVKSRSPSAKPAGWQRVGAAAFDFVEDSGSLPGPEVYLSASGTVPEKAQARVAKAVEIAAEIVEVKRHKLPTGGIDVVRLGELNTARSELEPKLDAVLEGLTDVDPYKLPEVRESVKVRVSLKQNVAEVLLKLHLGIGTLIEEVLAQPKEGTPDLATSASKIALCELAEVQTEKGTAVRLLGKETNTNTFMQDGERNKKLSFLLESFHRTRDALERAYPDLLKLQPRPSPELKSFMLEVERALGPLMCGDSDRTRRMFAALATIDDPGVRDISTRLLVSRSLSKGSNSFELTLDRPENFSLFTQTVGVLVLGPPATRQALEEALTPTSLRSVVDYCARIRSDIEHGKLSKVARFADEELERLMKPDAGTFVDRATLLGVLRALGADETVRRSLKGRIKNLKHLDEIKSAVLKKASGDAAHAVEGARAFIAKRFLADLSDYWGNRELVKEFRKLLTDNLELLAKPESWNGLPAHKVVLNGFLLYGVPGGGKTYLVTCATNEFEIPLVTITREEMAEAFLRAEQASQAGDRGKSQGPVDRPRGNEMESSLAQFMEGKIQQAKKEMQKSGARACILFIDEMEAEFQNRDPRTSQRRELAQTNIMLRVIERLITQHSDIFFVGATNHFDQVDNAALRPGRFGIHLHVDLPREEDVGLILEGTFGQLDLALTPDHSTSDAYTKLVKASVGLTPYAINGAINNAVSLMRAAKGVDSVKVNDDLFVKLAQAIERMRKFDRRGAAQQESGNSQR